MNTREEPASTSTSEQTITTTSVEISEENAGGKTCRSKRVVCVIEKLNMIFLVFFVCYLSWTIPANYGLFTSNESGVDINGTMGNAKGQNEEANSTGRKHDGSSTNFTDFYSRTVHQFNNHLTGSQNPFKRRRKQKLKNGRKNDLNQNALDTEHNSIVLTDSKADRQKNRRNRNKNKNTKRRKSRRKQKISFDNTLEPTTIRHIIETVAKEELAKGGNWNTHKGNGAPQVTLSVGDNSVIDNPQHSTRKNNKNGRRKIPPSGGRKRGDGRWSWSEWGPCSTTCGVGQKERNRKCGMACKEVESMVCFMPSCEGNGNQETQESGKKHFSSFYLWENDNFVPKPPGKDYIDPEVDNCGTWMDCNREVITEYFKKTDLPSCPCTYPLHLSYNEKVWDKQKKRHFLWLDASGEDEAMTTYKPAAQHCIRSKLVPGTDTLAAQHCCYDSATRLITRGKSAGTPNLISPEISPELHQKVDISPWIICKGDWTRYNEIIPPNNLQECEENPRNKEFLQEVKLAKNF